MDATDATDAPSVPNPPFIPGLELARRYYGEVVRPLLDRPLTGAVDQFVDSTDAIGGTALPMAAVRSLITR